MDDREYELLQEFARAGSGKAFAELAERYSGLIHGAAMRSLADHHLAEDAVQATLMILARKAGALGKKVMLGSWLWQTATLVCRNMKRKATRRQQREAVAHAANEIRMAVRSEAKRAWAAVQPYLDEGLARLPAKAREALVARYLVGKTTREIAQELGIRENTVAVRIHTGTKKLRTFLAARGVRVSGGLLIVLLGREAAAGVPAALSASVASAVAGATDAATALPPTARLLVDGTLRAMMWAKVKVAAVATAGTVATVAAVAYVAPLVVPHFRTTPAPEVPVVGPTRPACYLIRGGDVMKDLPRVADRADVAGVMKSYRWDRLEPREGSYDFTAIETDLTRLKEHGKRLWLAIDYGTQRTGWAPRTPDYIQKDPRYGGSETYRGSYERPVGKGGWLLCVWNPRVRSRLIALYDALGKHFADEPAVTGFVLPQTATGRPPHESGYGYTVPGERDGFMALALAAKRAFRGKVVLQTVNSAVFKLPDFTAWLAENGIGIHCFFIRDSFELGGSLQEAHRLCATHRDRVPTALSFGDLLAFDGEPAALRARHIRDTYLRALEVLRPSYVFAEPREPTFSEIVMPSMNTVSQRRRCTVHASLYKIVMSRIVTCRQSSKRRIPIRNGSPFASAQRRSSVACPWIRPCPTSATCSASFAVIRCLPRPSG